MSISIVLPSYKEAENLCNIIPQINEALKKLEVSFEILVVDTENPMDNTEEICKINQCKYIPRRGGDNYGDAIRTGFSEANMEYTVVMDADGSHDPKDIVRFYKVMKKKQCDLVIGSRYCKGGTTDNNFILRLMSRTLNVAYKKMFGLKVKDVSDSYRMYKTTQIKILKTECENFDIVEEILIALNYTNKNFKICEIPIRFNKRQAGKSKRNLVKFIISYVKTMKRLLRIKKRVIGGKNNG